MSAVDGLAVADTFTTCAPFRRSQPNASRRPCSKRVRVARFGPDDSRRQERRVRHEAHDGHVGAVRDQDAGHRRAMPDRDRAATPSPPAERCKSGGCRGARRSSSTPESAIPMTIPAAERLLRWILLRQPGSGFYVFLYGRHSPRRRAGRARRAPRSARRARPAAAAAPGRARAWACARGRDRARDRACVTRAVAGNAPGGGAVAPWGSATTKGRSNAAAFTRHPPRAVLSRARARRGRGARSRPSPRARAPRPCAARRVARRAGRSRIHSRPAVPRRDLPPPAR